jgi:hypothetical protein
MAAAMAAVWLMAAMSWARRRTADWMRAMRARVSSRVIQAARDSVVVLWEAARAGREVEGSVRASRRAAAWEGVGLKGAVVTGRIVRLVIGSRQ